MTDEPKKSAADEAKALGGGYMEEPAEIGLSGSIPVVGLCPHCHVSVQPEMLLCPNCGAKLHELWPGKPPLPEDLPKVVAATKKTPEFADVMAGFRDEPRVYAMGTPAMVIRAKDGLLPTLEELDPDSGVALTAVVVQFSPKYVDVRSLCRDITMALRDGCTVGLFSVVQEMGEEGGIRARWARYKVPV